MQVAVGTGTITITPAGGSAAALASASQITLAKKDTQLEWRGNNKFAVLVATVASELTATLDFIEMKADLVAAAMMSTTASGTPKSATMTNEVAGIADTFALAWSGTFNSQAGTYSIPTATSPDFSFALKEGAWGTQSATFKAYAAAAGTIMTFTAVE